MGSGVSSFVKSLTSAPAIWTDEELEENARIQKSDKLAIDYIVAHIYHDIPIRYGKKSVDPRSPMWIEISPQVQVDAIHNEGEIDLKMLSTVPSGMIVDYKGNIQAFFTNIDVSYTFHVSDIIKVNMFRESSKSKSIITIPAPPSLQHADTTSILLKWVLPFPPGVTTKVEIYYTSSLDIECADNTTATPSSPSRKGTNESKVEVNMRNRWLLLVTKSWDFRNFSTYKLEELSPGVGFYFRIRYKCCYGWSEFSEPSKYIKTLPSVPEPPLAVISGAILSDSVQLFWSLPLKDNGAPITDYILQGRGVGDEFVELYKGPLRSHLALNLHPEFAYSFRVAALNEVGLSEFSQFLSIKTPPRGGARKKATLDETQTELALQFAEAWTECWDPKTEQYFYFNKITGTRQLEKPVCLVELEENKPSVLTDVGIERVVITTASNRILSSVEKEKQFRVKRYRIIRALRKETGRGTGRTSLAASASTPNVMAVSTSSPVVSSHDDADIPDSGSPSRKIEPLLMQLNRGTILFDGYMKLVNVSKGDLINKRLRVQFEGEDGIDSGGIAKEGLLLLSKEALHYGGPKHRGWLRNLSETDTNSKRSSSFDSSGRIYFSETEKLKASPPVTSSVSCTLSELSVSKLQERKITGAEYGYFLGRLIGKSLYDRQLLDVPLSQLLLRQILGQVNREDSEETTGDYVKNKDTNGVLKEIRLLDPSLGKSLQWMLENTIDNILFETFSVTIENEDVGIDSKTASKVIALCPNGLTRDVTDENKWEYASLLAKWKTTYAVSALLEPFLKGFYELIPLKILQENQLTFEELDEMLNGKAAVDIEELRAYVMYQGNKDFDEKHEAVVWFWQIIRECDDSNKRNIIKFFTGSTRVPLDGYDPPLNITQGVDMVEDSLPRAHTCFNQLVLPAYSSYTLMKEKILFAIENTEGFELA